MINFIFLYVSVRKNLCFSLMRTLLVQKLVKQLLSNEKLSGTEEFFMSS